MSLNLGRATDLPCAPGRDKGSAKSVLHRIARPTLIVHSEDDPICPVSAMPLGEMASNPHLLTAITRHGGHMGYTAGLSPLAHTWTDRLLVHFLKHFDRTREAGGSSPHTLPSSPATGKHGSHDAQVAAQGPPAVPIFAVPSRL